MKDRDSFLEQGMDYKRQYDLLIEKARQRGAVEGYKERHHIVPRCMGGSNKKENLVELTAREHFVAHRLLYMHYKTPQMAYAWYGMCRRASHHQRNYSSRHYEQAREAFSKAKSQSQIGQKRGAPSEETKKKISLSLQGRKLGPQSKEHREKRLAAVTSPDAIVKRSQTMKGRKLPPRTESHRANHRNALIGKKYGAMSPERKHNISIAQKKRWAMIKPNQTDTEGIVTI